MGFLAHRKILFADSQLLLASILLLTCSAVLIRTGTELQALRHTVTETQRILDPYDLREPAHRLSVSDQLVLGY